MCNFSLCRCLGDGVERDRGVLAVVSLLVPVFFSLITLFPCFFFGCHGHIHLSRSPFTVFFYAFCFHVMVPRLAKGIAGVLIIVLNPYCNRGDIFYFCN